MSNVAPLVFPLHHGHIRPSPRLEPVLAHSFETATPWRQGIFAVDSAAGGGSKEYVACGDFPQWVAEGLVAAERDEHAYEILPEGRAVYPYVDIEFDAEELDADEVRRPKAGFLFHPSTNPFHISPYRGGPSGPSDRR